MLYRVVPLQPQQVALLLQVLAQHQAPLQVPLQSVLVQHLSLLEMIWQLIHLIMFLVKEHFIHQLALHQLLSTAVLI